MGIWVLAFCDVPTRECNPEAAMLHMKKQQREIFNGQLLILQEALQLIRHLKPIFYLHEIWPIIYLWKSVDIVDWLFYSEQEEKPFSCTHTYFLS